MRSAILFSFEKRVYYTHACCSAVLPADKKRNNNKRSVGKCSTTTISTGKE